MDHLNEHFDLVLTGTGLTETIVAAAASRAGKKVLQIDRESYYGGDWATLSLVQLEKWATEFSESDQFCSVFSDVEIVTNFPDDNEWTHERLQSESNKINLDFSPRLIFSDGAMVKLLIQSNICRYLEFKNCTRLLQLDKETSEWIIIPCTRDAVFADKRLSLIQKRKFMKFVDKCLNQMEESDQSQVSFQSILKSTELDNSLSDLLEGVVEPDTQISDDGLNFMHNFIRSAGKFGPTPYLWTLYGSGELPQAFARLSAVFGGTYCLKQKVKDVKAVDGKLNVQLDDDTNVSCSAVTGSVISLPKHLLSLSDHLVSSHAICITCRSIFGDSEHQITSARMSHTDGRKVSIIEVDSDSLSICSGLFLLYISCPGSKTNAKDDLKPVLDKIFKTSSAAGSVAIWSCFYNRRSPQTVSCSVKDVHVVRSSSHGVDYESCIGEAKAVFESLFPGETFLPRAPDAEDVIIEGEKQESENIDPE